MDDGSLAFFYTIRKGKKEVGLLKPWVKQKRESAGWARMLCMRCNLNGGFVGFP